MTRVSRLITVRRSTPEVGTMPVDGVHMDIACVLRRMQWILKHTCMHEDEPIYSDECVTHILDELHDLVHHIKELGGSLGHLDSCKILRDRGAHEDVQHYLDAIAHEVDSLHENVRKFLVENQGRTHDYGHHVYGGIAAMRASVCERVRKMYHEFLKKMHDHGLIDRDLHISLQLS